MGRHKGYTIIELIVVLALFSMFFSIAVPNFSYFSRSRETQELKEFKRDVLFARNQAIVKGKIHYFQLKYSENSYAILCEKDFVKRVNLQHGITLTNNSPPVAEITFTRSGVPLKGGTIKLKTSDNQKYELVVNPVTGKITLREE